MLLKVMIGGLYVLGVVSAFTINFNLSFIIILGMLNLKLKLLYNTSNKILAFNTDLKGSMEAYQ